MKLGLTISRAMVGLLGPYEKLYISNEILKDGTIKNIIEFFIYTNLTIVENRYRSSH